MQIARFSPDIQQEPLSKNIGVDGFVQARDLEDAVRCLLKNQQGLISLKAFDRTLQADLERFEPDHPGL